MGWSIIDEINTECSKGRVKDNDIVTTGLEDAPTLAQTFHKVNSAVAAIYVASANPAEPPLNWTLFSSFEKGRISISVLNLSCTRGILSLVLHD